MRSPSITTSRPLPRAQFRSRRTSTALRNERGFSLLEIAIVVGLILIATTIALLMVRNVVRSVHLQQTASNYANLLQQARVRAVQDDQYYSVVANSSSTVTCPAGVNYCAFIDIKGTGVYDPVDPLLPFAPDVRPMPFGSGPALTNLEAQFLPSSGTWITVNSTAPGPTFSPRGLPCTPNTSGSYTTCTSVSTPTSYIVFMKNVRSSNWEAITVTPAGRIHLWSYSQSSGWSPLN